MVTLSEVKTIIDMIGAPITIIEVKSGPRFVWRMMNVAAEKYTGRTNKEYRGKEFNFDGLDELQVSQRKRSIFSLNRCVASKESVFYPAISGAGSIT